MKKALLSLLAIFSSMVLISCSKPKDFNNSFDTMNTTVRVIIFKQDKKIALAQSIYNKIKLRFEEINKLTDNFKEYENVKNVFSINAAPREENIEINKELYDLLELSEKYRKDTNGFFDISIGNHIDRWKNLLEKDEVSKEDIEAEEEIGQRLKAEGKYKFNKDSNIVLTNENNKYYVKLTSNTKIDLGAIAKGYAVNEAKKIIDEHDVKYYVINAGGSSVYYGENPNRKGGIFIISLRGNDDEIFQKYNNYYYLYINIKEKSLTGSGDSVQRVKIGDRTVHHVISPETLKPENYRRVVTIYHTDATFADALSTALVSMDDAEFEAWKAKNNDIKLIVLKNNLEIDHNLDDDLIVS